MAQPEQTTQAPEVVEAVEPASNYEATLTFETTAYTAWCDTGCIGITATGIDVNNTITHEGRRIVAVDPSVIPLGTYLTLNFADGSTIEAVAEDTGGAIKGNRLDLLVSDKDTAWNFGRQDVEVTIHN